MNENTMCQSCGLPFNEEHTQFMQKEPDGNTSLYCTLCYKDGQFLAPEVSMEEMIESIVPILGKSIGEDTARKEMKALFPTLKRWK
jgi:hypothetical protein